MATVTTETLYIESATSLKEKLARYDAIILALETQIQNVAAGNSDIEEYMLDDGQVKIKTLYRNVESIAKAILRFEQMRETIINKLNGRAMQLKPYRGLI